MKKPIILIIANDNYFQPTFLHEIFEVFLKSNYCIERVFILKKLKKPSTEKYLLNNLFNLKISEIFKLSLLKFFPRMINCFIDIKIKYFSINKIIFDQNIKFNSNINLSEPKVIQHLLKKRYSLILNTGAQIFTKKIIKKYKNKIVNIHLSLLPKYPGVWTMFQQMANNEKYTGVTIHAINEKIDGGKIILKEKILLNKNYSIFENQLNCYKHIPSMIKFCVLKQFKVSKSITPQKTIGYPTSDDWKKFRKNNMKII